VANGTLWHVPVSGRGGPRQLDPTPAISFAPLKDGYVLACLRGEGKGERGYLSLLSTRGPFSRRIGNLPIFDQITDVSPDAHIALLARSTHDDREELAQESALWTFELADSAAGGK
jgi:hypothetical protein